VCYCQSERWVSVSDVDMSKRWVSVREVGVSQGSGCLLGKWVLVRELLGVGQGGGC